MSGLEPTTPPVGEELHLPGPAIAPVLVAVGLVLLLLAASVSWIRHAHRELQSLPPGH